MKKIAVFIIALLYFTVSSGVIVNMHYCMNRFASADVGFFTTKKKCDKCGMHKEDSHGCCHDEVKLVKMNDDHNKSFQIAFDVTSIKTIITGPSIFIATPFYNSNKRSGYYTGNDLHMPNQQDTYLENCVFRI